MPASPATVALSTWTLDPLLAARYPDSPAAGPGGRKPHTGPLDILDLPAEVARRGYDRLEVPHFHLPHESAAQDKFAAAARGAGVALQTLLVDDGDPADPEHGGRDEAWAAGWIRTAGALGFERVRLTTGHQPYAPEAFARLTEAVERLVAVAEGVGVRPSVENWHRLLGSPEPVLALLDRLKGRLALCADFGNWAPSMRERLPEILPRAETIHAKAEFAPDGTLDEPLLRVQVAQAVAAGFDGPYVLVAGGPHDVWDGAARTRDLIRQTVATATS